MFQYLIQTRALIQEFPLAIKEVFQSPVKAVEILKSGPNIERGCGYFEY